MSPRSAYRVTGIINCLPSRCYATIIFLTTPPACSTMHVHHHDGVEPVRTGNLPRVCWPCCNVHFNMPATSKESWVPRGQTLRASERYAKRPADTDTPNMTVNHMAAFPYKLFEQSDEQPGACTLCGVRGGLWQTSPKPRQCWQQSRCGLRTVFAQQACGPKSQGLAGYLVQYRKCRKCPR